MVAQVIDQVPRSQFTAAAGQTIFAYNFQIFAKPDITVTTSLQGTLVVDVDYTVSDVGNINGGNVTLTVGATVNEIITIFRSMAFDRVTDYQESGDFLAQTVDDDFNRLWLAGQQDRETINRSLRFDVDDVVPSSILPVKADRASKFLAFDSAGVPIVLPGTTSPVIDLYLRRNTLADMVSDTNLVIGNFVDIAGRITVGDGGDNSYEIVAAGTGTDDGGSFIDLVTHQAKALFPKGKVYAKQFGLIGDSDGTTGNGADDTIAFQKFIIFLEGFAGTGFLGDDVIYRTTAPLTVTKAMSIEGTMLSPITHVSTESGVGINHSLIGMGSWLYFDHLGRGIDVVPDLLFPRMTGSRFTKFGTLRNQDNPGGGWTPTISDYDLYFGGATGSFPSDTLVEDVHLHNTSHGIYMGRRGGTGTGSANRMFLNRITGQPLVNGINLDRCLDVVHLGIIHFWVYWSIDSNVLTYTQANLNSVIVNRADGAMLGELFAFGAFSTLRVVGSGADNAEALTVESVKNDNGQRCILVDGSDNNITVASMTFQGVNPTALEAIRITGDDNTIRVTHMKTNTHATNAVSLSGTGNKMWLDSAIFQNWNLAAGGDSAILVGAGNFMYIANTIEFVTAGERYLGSGTIVRHTDVLIEGNSHLTTTGAASLFFGHGEADAVNTRSRKICGHAGRIVKIQINSSDPSGSETYVYTLYINGIVTTMTGTINGGSTAVVITTNQQDIAGQSTEVNMQVVSSAGSAAAIHRFLIFLDTNV